MSKLFKLFANQYFWLGLILLVSFEVRIYRIDSPIADWHSWRQSDTAAVARNFYKEGFNPLYPKSDNMAGVAANYPVNASRYLYTEFPIYNSLVYLGYLINNGIDLKIARLVNILISLVSLVLVYVITKQHFGQKTALIAGLIFGLLPFNVYYSRTTLPEPSLVCFSLGMFFFTYNWLRNSRWVDLTLGLFFSILAFLTKPSAVFYLLPLLYLTISEPGRFWSIVKRLLVFTLISVVPLLLWRFWILRHPESIPAAGWLFNGTNIRLRPAFFKWIIGDRFGREILSVAGSFLFFLGIIIKPKLKEGWLLHTLALSSFLYLVIIASGNVTHDYYQVFIVPVLAIFAARGFMSLINGELGLIPRLWTIPLGTLFLLLTFYLSWQEVKGLYQINNPVIVEAGQMADKVLPKDAVVIAPYNGDTAFLYQTNRPGFARIPYPHMVADLNYLFHTTHYVSVNFDNKTNWLMKHYQVLVKTPNYVIIDLTKLAPGANPSDYRDPD